MFRPYSFIRGRTPRWLHFRRNCQTESNSSYKKLNKSRSLFLVSAGSVLTYVGGSLLFGGENFYRDCAMPIVHSLLDGENAHRLAVSLAKWNLVPIDFTKAKYPVLETEVFGLRFETPVGLAAGFDKDGEAVAGLHNMGFAFVEVGSVTPLPQDGNPKPRVFRLPEDGAVINRYGFNSAGHEVVHRRLVDFRESAVQSSSPAVATSYTRNSLPQVLVRDCDSSSLDAAATAPSAILGVNLGKNKTSPSPIGDYVSGVERFAPVADYLVVNVSSPNTPGLRDMQAKATLEALLDAVLDKLKSLPGSRKPPLLVKIAPDLADGDAEDVVQVLLERSGFGGVAGVIVSNTTVSRPATLQHQDIAKEVGGLSGKPLKDLSTEMIERVYKASGGKIPIIGCGGISTGGDAYEKILAGASLVQIYSALVYGGPPVVKAITRELSELLKKDGFESVEQAVGAGSLKTANLKAVRDFMEDMVLDRFAKEQQAAQNESREAVVEVERTEPTRTTTIDGGEEEEQGALQAHYYNVPPSHLVKKNSPGIPSAS